MKYQQYLWILVFVLLVSKITAQFGIRTSYDINRANTWDDFFESVQIPSSNIFNSSTTYTLDYWVRLRNTRIEFYPNISFRQSSTVLTPNDFKLRQLGIGILSHIYLFDLIGDCDCPTFSKQGNLIKKGFFVLAGIGTDYSSKGINGIFDDQNMDLKVQLGIGLDIGISDFFTITPFGQFTYFPDVSWHTLGPVYGSSINNVNSSLRLLQLGVRLGFRPDYR